ncbi:MAG: beta-glucuronidase [Phycisphaerae bacterium]|nr:beta-glucuronidase [Phycisphaerae bacterium]
MNTAPRLVAFFLCAFFARAMASSPLAGIVRTTDFDTVSLDGDWAVIPDRFDQGRYDFLSRPRHDGFWMDRRAKDETERVEYLFSDEHTLRVPGDWNTQDERFFFYEGSMWYRTAFNYEADEQLPRSFLRFDAANKVAEVWLNGERLGMHEVGFTPFAFEVTESVRPGENVVVVRVDNTRRPDLVPAMVTDWWNYGGITRSVHFVRTPGTFVRDAHIELTPNRTVTGWAVVDGANAGKRSVSFELEGVGATGGVTDDDGLVRFELNAGAAPRWTPEDPRLLGFTASIEGHRFEDRVGLRTIEARDGDIYLNGERVFLEGICIHEEALSRRGRAYSEADARELLGLAKELGCNYVRLAHYPHNEHMLRVADELGLMVWAEIPVYWKMAYESERTLALAKTHLREMIARDHNRASVIIWSVGNETGDDPAVTAFRTELGRYVKSLDPSRLLSAAMFARQIREDGELVRMRVDDPFGEIADVLAINEYVGWYHDQPEDISGVEVELAWNKPFVISETGAGVKQGRGGSPEAIWSEAFGVRYYREQLGWALSLENCDGVSPWILKDFLSPRRALYGVQDWYNRKGLVSETGERKDVFSEVQRMYLEHEPDRVLKSNRSIPEGRDR